MRGPSAARDGRRGLSLRRRADHKETGLEDYCLDERPDPERHPKATERLTAPASHAISHAGSELSGPKVDGRRYAACLVNGASRTGLPRHARPLSQRTL